VLSLLVLSAGTGTAARDTVTGNVVAVDRFAAPEGARWYTGRLRHGLSATGRQPLTNVHVTEAPEGGAQPR
jgi:hypothetical protein